MYQKIRPRRAEVVGYWQRRRQSCHGSSLIILVYVGNFERSCALNGTLPPSELLLPPTRTFSPLNLERRREGMSFDAWSADLMTQIKLNNTGIPTYSDTSSLHFSESTHHERLEREVFFEEITLSFSQREREREREISRPISSLVSVRSLREIDFPLFFRSPTPSLYFFLPSFRLFPS